MTCIIAWFREFQACADANSWNDDVKLKKLPAFLRGEAANHFDALTEERRSSYVAVTKALKLATCSVASKEVFYAEFEVRMLNSGEDLSVYNWKLEQMFPRAEPNSEAGAITILLT